MQRVILFRKKMSNRVWELRHWSQVWVLILALLCAACVVLIGTFLCLSFLICKQPNWLMKNSISLLPEVEVFCWSFMFLGTARSYPLSTGGHASCFHGVWRCCVFLPLPSLGLWTPPLASDYPPSLLSLQLLPLCCLLSTNQYNQLKCWFQ